MNKKHRGRKEKIRIVLTRKNITMLRAITRSGVRNAHEITRARILLLSHEGRTNSWIVSALGCSPRSVTAVRQRYTERKRDVMATISDASRPGQPKKILPIHEAFVVATACTEAPVAHSHWTLDELRKKLLKTYTGLKTVSDERIRRILIKNELKPWREKNVVRSKSQSAFS